jgi:hypothetical protein
MSFPPPCVLTFEVIKYVREDGLFADKLSHRFGWISFIFTSGQHIRSGGHCMQVLQSGMGHFGKVQEYVLTCIDGSESFHHVF